MNKKPVFGFGRNRLQGALALLAVVIGLHSQAVGDVYQELLNFEYGKSREAFWRVESQIRQAGPDGKLEIQSRLLQALQDPRATIAARQSICATLLMIGSCQSVPVLQTLLTDEKVSDAARSALQGLPCPEVDRIFREAVTTTEGQIRLGLITSLGERRDREAVRLLSGLLKNSDPATSRAVLAALGRIGGEEAAESLKAASVPPALQSARNDAYLSCAATLVAEGRSEKAKAIYLELLKSENGVVEAAALAGIVRIEKEAALDHILSGLQSRHAPVRQAAALLINEVPGLAATTRILKLLPTLPPATQVPVVSALGERSGTEALPLLAKLWKDGDQAVQVAAGQALGKLGDRTSVEPLILSAKTPGPIGVTALESLRILAANGVNEEIARYARHSDPALRVIALRTLTARRYSGASALGFAALQDPALPVRIEGWRSLGVFGKPEELSRLIGLMIKLEDSREQQAAEQAIQVVSEPAPKDQAAQFLLDAMPGSTPAQRCALLRTLGRVGGEKSFASIRGAVNDQDAEVRDTAVRVLSEWGDVSVSNDLLRLAKEGKTETHRVLGLRGYVRLAGISRHDNEGRVKMYETALSVAARDDEKKLVLGAAGGVPSVAALTLVEPYLGDDKLRTEAQAAYFKIAVSVVAQDPVLAADALRRLIKVADEPELKARAEEALKRLAN